MKSLASALLAFLLTVGATSIATGTEAEMVLRACESYRKVFVERSGKPSDKQIMEAGVCLGYVRASASTVLSALKKAGRKPCREHPTSSKMVGVAYAGLASQPERWNEPAAKLIMEALTDYFTCREVR